MLKSPALAPSSPPISPEQMHHEETLRLVSKFAKSVIGKYGFTRSDRDDIEQDLTLDLLERSRQYDPERCKLRSFVISILRNKLRSMIRDQQRKKRREVPMGDGVFNIYDGAQYRSPGEPACDDIERFELEHDLAVVMKNLPPDLRQLAELLPDSNPHAIARKLGISRRAMAQKLEALRQHFLPLE